MPLIDYTDVVSGLQEHLYRESEPVIVVDICAVLRVDHSDRIAKRASVLKFQQLSPERNVVVKPVPISVGVPAHVRSVTVDNVSEGSLGRQPFPQPSHLRREVRLSQDPRIDIPVRADDEGVEADAIAPVGESAVGFSDAFDSGG